MKKTQDAFERQHPLLVQKVVGLVTTYKELFPTEYEQVKELVLQKRGELVNEKTGAVKGTHVQERILTETPEKLWAAIVRALDTSEINTFSTKEAARWFAKRFPEFRVPESI